MKKTILTFSIIIMTITVFGGTNNNGYFNDSSFAASFSVLLSILMLATFVFMGITWLIAWARELRNVKMGNASYLHQPKPEISEV